jgi:hypothetical protein
LSYRLAGRGRHGSAAISRKPVSMCSARSGFIPESDVPFGGSVDCSSPPWGSVNRFDCLGWDRCGRYRGVHPESVGYRFLPKRPRKLGNFPRAVCRTALATGEYSPTFAFTRCLTRDGFTQASTWDTPSSRLTLRFAAVTPSTWLREGLRYRKSFMVLPSLRSTVTCARLGEDSSSFR